MSENITARDYCSSLTAYIHNPSGEAPLPSLPQRLKALGHDAGAGMLEHLGAAHDVISGVWNLTGKFDSLVASVFKERVVWDDNSFVQKIANNVSLFLRYKARETDAAGDSSLDQVVQRLSRLNPLLAQYSPAFPTRRLQYSVDKNSRRGQSGVELCCDLLLLPTVITLLQMQDGEVEGSRPPTATPPAALSVDEHLSFLKLLSDTEPKNSSMLDYATRLQQSGSHDEAMTVRAWDGYQAFQSSFSTLCNELDASVQSLSNRQLRWDQEEVLSLDELELCHAGFTFTAQQNSSAAERGSRSLYRLLSGLDTILRRFRGDDDWGGWLDFSVAEPLSSDQPRISFTCDLGLIPLVNVFLKLLAAKAGTSTNC